MSIYRNERPQPDQPLIELRHVSRQYTMQRSRHRSLQEMFIRWLRREKKVNEVFWPLRDVSFAIHPGDCVGIIGPNGAGKSTLLKLITGILAPTEGDLFVNGRISSLLELGAGFHPDLTGRENIYLNGSIYGLSRAQMDKKLDSIIDYAELGEFIDTPIKHYSSGMYVRLGFAVAIHTNPDLLLVDEVLAVGDAAFQRKCLTSIQKFRDNGGTLVFVSHDLTSIQTICKRVLWLEHGKIQAEGHPTEVIMAYIQHLAALEEAKQGGKEAKSPATPGEAGDEEQAKIQRRWGSGEIRIAAVELCDVTGQPRAAFRNGEPMIIRLSYEASTRVEAPIFGLAIYHQNGTHIAGPNTKFGDFSIPFVHGAGAIDYHIPQVALLEGSYTLSVAVINTTDTITYDYHDRLYDFQIYRGQSKELYGLVTLNGHWRQYIVDPAELEEAVPLFANVVSR